MSEGEVLKRWGWGFAVLVGALAVDLTLVAVALLTVGTAAVLVRRGDRIARGGGL